MIIFLNTALDLNIFSPSEPVGILIIFIGLIFFLILIIILTFIFGLSSENDYYEKLSKFKIPERKVLFLSAVRFMSSFVEAVKSNAAVN